MCTDDNKSCNSGFRCPYDGSCIPLNKVCDDAVFDCPYNSEDQLNCGTRFSKL